MGWAPDRIVDLERYPIADRDSTGWHALVRDCRQRLADNRALSLPGFVRPEQQDAMADEARALSADGHVMTERHTVYFEPADPAVAPDHPRRRLGRTTKGGVAADRIPPDAMLRAVYEWDALKAFIATVLDEPVLYRHADPMAALNIGVFRDGFGLDWHFDRADFAVTLSIQTAARGGVFEYVPNLRSDADQNYEAVSRLLDGEDLGIRTLPFEAGTLALFRSHNSPHRVTPVVGGRDRLAAVLSYVREPGVTFSPYAQELFYGRAAAPDGPR